MSPQRWGVLGGVFDPIHYAHLAIAEQTCDALSLDGVLFMPAAVPTHRAAPHAAAKARAAMAQAAIADNPRFVLSRMEIDRGGPSFSVETAQQLSDERPDDTFVLILSAESASYLPEWREPERLLALAEIAVVPRLGYADLSSEWLTARFPGHESRFSFVSTSRLGHSSSEVRARVAARMSIRYLVPPAVEGYIREHGLYGPHERRAA